MHLGPRATRKIAALLLVSAMVIVASPLKEASAGEQVNGSGSTWSAIMVLQWQADVARQGLSINFTANGSSTGRKYYIQAQSDFAVSEIPFQEAYKDRTGATQYDEIDQAEKRPYAYMPIVAGGTSFMYNLNVGGKRVHDLRLSGATIAKIFTGGIKNWNDPAIAADDGRHFPSKQIKPVVRSDGSGTSAQFSAYMLNQYPNIWKPFATKRGIDPNEATSLYPYFDGSQAQAGSDGVASAVAAPYNDGGITYVEYGYAKQRGFPVVSVQNRAGYFVQPTAGNVSVALQQARINPDRTQVLTGVYTNPDKRAYPVSSYSYMIVPTSTAAPFTKGKGETLGRFILYFLCTGQQKAEGAGYSPLPKNLVEFAFQAERLIPGAPAPPPINQCANPMITGGGVKTPPPPAEADPNAVRPALGGGGGGGGTQVAGGRVGGNGPAADNSNTGAGNVTTPNTDSTTSTKAGGATKGTGSKTATRKGTTKSSRGAAGTGAADAGSTATTAPPTQLATVASIQSKDERVPVAIYGAVGVFVLLAVFAPPAVSVGLDRRRRQGTRQN